MILLLGQPIADACTLVNRIEPECEIDPAACERRHLRNLYERADVVFEVTVQTARELFLDVRRRSLNSVTIEHIWKSDGRPLDLVEAGSGGGDCTVSLSVGTTYVIFAFRRASRWSFLPWVEEPLYAGIAETFERAEFKAQSPYHAELYMTRTPESLQLILEKLAK